VGANPYVILRHTSFVAASDSLLLGASIAGGAIVGILVGTWAALRMAESWLDNALRSAGELVTQSLQEAEVVALRVLTHPSVQQGIRAADKVSNLVGKGGIGEKITGFIGKFLGGK